MLTDRPILYSATTTLAYNINQRFYGDLHYLWCTPHFNSSPSAATYTVPPTSSPFEIYTTLAREVAGVDSHSEKIRLNKVGIKRGAQIMRQRGIITEAQLKQIYAVVRLSQIGLFKPLLCIISSLAAQKYCTEVDISKKANPLSHEFIAADLPRTAFDVIALG